MFDQLVSFLRKDPTNTFLAADLLGKLLASGQAAYAITLIEELPAETRADQGLRFLEARAYLQSSNPGRAANILRELISEGANAPAIYHDLAFAEFAQGRFVAAEQALLPALHEHPPLPEVQVLHARLLHWQDRLQDALDAIDNALAMRPDNVEAAGVRSLLLLDLNRFDEAGYAALAALSHAPGQLEAGITAGTLALWNQRVEEALTVFGSTVERHPRAGRAVAGLGQAHMLGGDIVAARQLLEHAVVLMPQHIGTWHALAWCQLLTGKRDGAQHSYERAFELDRSFGETHGGFAILHALRGETADAEAAITRARRLDPTGRSAVYAQALLLMNEGRDAEAAALVSPILAQMPIAQATDALEFLQKLRAQMAQA